MSKLIQEIMDAINAVNKNKTEPYDRQGEVKRIEGKIAWVKLEGSDRETPVQMTIACDVGDTVQARIGGGSAWLTGNLTAPPTDDKKANQAISMVTNVAQEVKEEVSEALEDVSTVDDVTMQYCLSDSSSTFIQYGNWLNTPPTYVSGKYYWTRTVLYDEDGNATYGTPQYSQDTQLSVETSRAYATTKAHFWYDGTGAYVTDSTQTAYQADVTGKFATRVTPTGILQSYGGNLLSAWTSSGIGFYDGDGTTADNSTKLAQFGSSGVNFYAGGSLVSSFGSSSISLGANSTSSVINMCAGALQMRTSVTSNVATTTIENYSTQTGKSMEVSAGHTRLFMSDYDNTTHSATLEVGNTLLSLWDSGATLNARGGAASVMGQNASITLSGTDTPIIDCTGRLQVDSNAIKNLWAVGNTNTGTPNTNINSSGYIHVTTNTSSRRYKHDIKPIENEMLDPCRLYDVEVVQFKYNEGMVTDTEDCRYDKELVGFIAEQFAEHYPIAVDMTKDGKCETWNAQYVIPPMLALIQDQNNRITELEERLS